MEEKKFCKFCGEEIDKSSVVCPSCGRQLQVLKNAGKNVKQETSNHTPEQPKFYEQQWFMWVMFILFAPVGIFLMWKFNKTLNQKTKIILSVVFAFIFLIIMTGNDNDKENKKIIWDDIELKEKIPMPKKMMGEIITNRSNLVILDISDISKSEYKNYINECRNKGYIIDLEYEPWDTVYGAFDKDGYSLRIIYSDYSKEMNITLKSPKKDTMKEIEWPIHGLGAILPKPKSNLGDISWNNSETFIVTIGNMNIDDYNEYVRICENNGFINDYSKSQKSYSATNSKGYKLHLMYLGANVIEISLKAPKDEDVEQSQDNNSNNSNNSTTNNNSNTGLSKEFKKAMDDYEKFIDEYVAFMKKYQNSNGINASMLNDYTKYLQKYTKMLSSYEEWGDKELNKEETKYYLEVQTRVSKKLIDASIK